VSGTRDHVDAGQDRACELVTQRLVASVGTASRVDDPLLSAHLGSCLRCFRTAADLREVPRLQKLLLEAQADAPPADPGEAFWSAFPAALGKAWNQRQRPGQPDAAAEAPGQAVVAARMRPGIIDRFWAWLRLPVPAALAGAACAAMVAVMVLRPGGQALNRSLPGAAVSVPDSLNQAGGDGAGEALAAGIGQDDISLSPGQAAVDESVGELGEVGLSTMLDKLDRELGGQPTFTPGDGQGDQQDLPDGASEQPGLPTTSDELGGLDEQGLMALRAGLRESI
jgi:hypothetical protein